MSNVWAIAAYFNPVGFSRRPATYHLFRLRLGIPLLTVQLVLDGRRDLTPADADKLVTLEDGDALWQKERLFNVALAHLPPEADYVAWLDTDIIFERPDWHGQAVAKLQHSTLIQPFSEGVDLESGDDERPEAWRERAVSGRSFAYKLVEAGHHPAKVAHQQTPEMARDTMPGFAWVARRDTMQRHGFFDGDIVGGADGAMAEAACGWIDHAAEFRSMPPGLRLHYRTWAERFHAEVGGRVDYVPGKLFHLWHGAISSRSYRERYKEIERLGYDPRSDVVLGSDGAWKFSPQRLDLKAYLQTYFARRREDD